MKISIKELKIEDDGCEVLFSREFGCIIPSKTFSETCEDKSEKSDAPNIKDALRASDFSALMAMLAQLKSNQEPEQPGAESKPNAAKTE